MKCCYCGKGMNEGVSLIPIEPKGTKDRKWSCTKCTSTKNVPKDVKEICSIFDKDFDDKNQ